MKQRSLGILLLCFIFFFESKKVVAQPTLFGMTKNGGDGLGVIFGVPTGSVSYNRQKNFRNDYPGSGPMYTHLTEANGKLYGMTRGGGAYNGGLLFEYDPATGTYTDKVDFSGPANGGTPYGSLTLAGNGKLYGLTFHGGVNNLGVLFEYDPVTNIFIKKKDFNGTANGEYPAGDLVQATNGKLYGMTNEGGNYDYGTLFEFNPATNVLIKKIDFDGSKGSYPDGSVIQAANGKLYGMVRSGGVYGIGTMFEYDITTNTYVKKLDFSGTLNGSYPYGSLMQAADGSLYGMTSGGGINNMGLILEYNPGTGIYTKRLEFDGTTGHYPYGDLMQAANGKLYGMTMYGGVYDYGTLFEYDLTTNTHTKKFDFDGGAVGRYPYGTMMQASNGNLYGMTSEGGADNLGILYEYNITTDVYAKKIDLNGAKEGNGAYPYGSLVQASNYKLFGTTHDGGRNGFGTLVEYDPVTNTYIKRFSFNSLASGSFPCGSLIQAYNGKLYGMTSTGGTNNLGVLYEYDIATAGYTKKLDLDGTTTGSNPYGSLLQALNGKLYGMTSTGGTNNSGVLFEYDATANSYTVKFNFDGAANGGSPLGSLFEAPNGKLYGMTQTGGSNSFGVLFEYDITLNTYTKKFDFDGAVNGSSPSGDLVKALNNKLYGMTKTGGTNNTGVLFEYDLSTNTYTKKLDFSGTTNGSSPNGSLVLATNGKLYGMTNLGGTNAMGVLFEYNPGNNTYTKKMDFNNTLGNQPLGNLIEVNAPFTVITLQSNVTCNSGSDASASVTALGGVAPYTYSWSPGGGLTVSENGLSAGVYTCRITDANAISVTHTFTINQPSAVVVTPTFTNITCLSNGSANMSTTGGTGSYTYSWTPAGGNAATSSSLTTGSYTCYVSDVNNCTTIASVSIAADTTKPTLSATTNNLPSCAGETATLSVTGNAASYTWSTSETTTDIVVSPTITTTYTVTGMGANGCADSTTVTQDVNICTGIAILSGVRTQAINVYPNPNNGVFYVELISDSRVSIMNYLGQTIANEEMSAGRQKLDIHNAADGLYFINIIENNKQHTVKFIKK